MKTLGQVLDEIDRLRPNGYEPEEKTEWLNELAARVQTDVWLHPANGLVQYDYDRDAETPLLLDESHERLYIAYLAMMIDFANGEYEKYKNSAAMFNSLWANYAAWYANEFGPADWRDGKNGMEVTP